MNRVTFCDIGGTLGEVEIVPPSQSLVLHLFGTTFSILQALAASRSLGIISNTGSFSAAEVNAMLHNAGILTLFNSELLIFSSEVRLVKDSPFIFELAAGRAGRVIQSLPSQCAFIGEKAEERQFALRAGFGEALTPAEAGLTGAPFVAKSKYVQSRSNSQ